MDAVEFYKSMKRMCYSGEMCEKCPLYNNFSEMGSVCDVLLHIEDEKASRVKSIVEQWAESHPVKTRQSEFLKLFPNATINESDGILCVTPCNIEGKEFCCAKGKSCGDCRRKYWLTEVTDNGNIY